MNKVVFEANNEKNTQIGDKVLCWQTGIILDQEQTIKLEPLPLAFLKYLAQRPGEIIDREQLLAAVWNNRFVSDDAIRGVVRKVREALNDNAKAPTYIKTVPLKGYMLIASVGTVSKAVVEQAPISKKITLVYTVMGSLGLLTIVFMNWFAGQYSSQPIENNPPAIAIERLTYMSGMESMGNYSEQLQTIIFSHMKDMSESASLYRKNLVNGRVERLTFDKGGHYNARFSPDSSQVAYIRETSESAENIITSYSSSGLSDAQHRIDSDQNKEILSWSANGESLYFRSSQFEPQQTGSTSIYRYNLANRDWQQVTFPHVQGSGDRMAEESADGRFLAVVRNTSDSRNSLLIMDLLKKQITREQALPFSPTKLLWLNKQNKRIAMSNHKGELYFFDIEQSTLQAQSGLAGDLSDVFYDCGENCFYMRQGKLNKLDMVEIPNPFDKGVKTASTHYESDHSEYYPTYNQTGDAVYFVRKDQSAMHLMRHTPTHTGETLFSIKATNSVSQLSIHPKEEYLGGKIEGRAFIFNLKNKKLTFITSQEAFVNISSWSRNGQYLYFSRLEQGHSVLLKYDVNSAQITPVEQNMKGLYELAQGRTFVIDEQDVLYQQTANGKREKIIKLPIFKLGGWQIQDKFLYFLEIKGISVYINQLNLNNGKRVRKILHQNQRLDRFSLHAQGHKLLITKMLSDEGNLVKVKLQ